MNIISRAAWGAKYSAGAGPAPLPAREVWLHHSVTIAPDLVPPFDDEDAAMRHLEEIGQQRFGQGVSYTFAAMPTGRVYEGHGVDRLGAHLAKRNGVARGIVLVGNYEDDEPTAEQIEAVATLMVDGWRAGWWTSHQLNGGHQDAPGASTACPGQHAEAHISAINTRAAAIAAAGTAPVEDTDMNAAQEQLLRDTFREVKAIREQSLGQNVAGDLQLIVRMLKELIADVDELPDDHAAQMVPLIGAALSKLPAQHLHAVGAELFTQQSRRIASLTAPPATELAVAVDEHQADVEPAEVVHDEIHQLAEPLGQPAAFTVDDAPYEPGDLAEPAPWNPQGDVELEAAGAARAAPICPVT